MKFEFTPAFAQQLDQEDSLRAFRQKFYIPVQNGKPVVYFTGNSLGLQPKTTRAYVEQELKDWETFGVEGHFKAKHPWFAYHEFLTDKVARLVGAKPGEVVMMNQLTLNLHLLMIAFYRPDSKRYKIIFENGPFPSDRYALESQVKLHGLNPADALLELQPRPGEYLLRTEDIVKKINETGNSLALVMLGGVNYYTGQYFDLPSIT
ncbi:MAG: kynureninase, partial [Flavobacteriales bacterium]